jgi:hypothetical protein
LTINERRKKVKHSIITTAIAVTMMTGFCFAQAAEETNSRDGSLRISIGNTPGIDKVENSGVGSLDPSDDGGLSVQVLGSRRFWSEEPTGIGGVLGGGFFRSTHSASGSDYSLDTEAFGGIIQGGLAIKAGENLVLELLPFAGAGIGANDVVVDGLIDDSGSGGYVMYGIKAGVYYDSDEVEIGLEVGSYAFEQDQEIELFGVSEDFTFSGSGATASIVFALTF